MNEEIIAMDEVFDLPVNESELVELLTTMHPRDWIAKYATHAINKYDENIKRIAELEAEVEKIKKERDGYADDSSLLDALRAAGVDNWDGYSEAQDILSEWNEEE